VAHRRYFFAKVLKKNLKKFMKFVLRCTTADISWPAAPGA
jgi:hypothetical protein